uniref:NADH-ubiquinone oxidoreductase chain 1 n=1 Tax=Abispa ephippium TaxID=485912 RepID=B6RQZ1_9HYME|nr:NADH dehydrogenase subunit 1 [Abispa ephippium]
MKLFNMTICMSDMFFIFMSFLLEWVGVLVSVAFFVLLERKLLGYVQDRLGPNKVGFVGIFQSVSDAIKLFSKEEFFLYQFDYYMYYLSPMIGFFMSLLLILSLPYNLNFLSMELFLLYLMSCLSMGGYWFLMASWASNSIYSMLGGIRSIVQALSYEVCMFIMFLIMFLYSESYSIKMFMEFKCMFILVNMGMFMLIYISLLAELNRMPFDFVEGESELVSGFNTEYMSGMFALFFLAEYLMMIIISMLLVILFLGLEMMSLKFTIMVMVIMMSLIMIRGVLPRMRYDLLMDLCWYLMLPLVLIMLYFMMILKFYI